MMLLIAAQDIGELTVGLIERPPAHPRILTLPTNPEGYLAAIDETLKEWKTSLDDLEGIVVVTGPGSFTASRVSTTIAKGLSCSKKIPLYAVANEGRLDARALVDTIDWSCPLAPSTFAVPLYDRPPQITKKKV